MYIGELLLFRYKGELKQGRVISIFKEDLEIRVDDNTIIIKKFWEVRKLDEKKS